MADPPAWLSLVNGGALTLAGGAVAWVFNQWHRARRYNEERRAVTEQTQARVSEHSTDLMREMLRVAMADVAAVKVDLAQAKAELDGLRDIERRLMHFEEALFHIERLLNAEESGDRDAAQTAAELFLAKMIALRHGRGIAANAEQSDRARRRLRNRPVSSPVEDQTED